MEQLFFVMDESGAKGYSDKTEAEPFELGVTAGFLLPMDAVEQVRRDLDMICTRYAATCKLHITDLAGAQQAALRCDIFRYFAQRGVAWTYNAAYVEGLKRSVDAYNEVLKDMERQRTSNLKYSNRPAKESLHAKLFTGAVQKAIAFWLDRGKTKFHLQIITDPIDAPVIAMFGKELDDFLSQGEERGLEAKAYDPVTRKLKRQAFTVSFKAQGDWALDLSGISYDIATETTSLTVAAEVLSNSVRYYLKRLQATRPGATLNGLDAMTAHPLQAYLYGTTPTTSHGWTMRSMPIQTARATWSTRSDLRRVEGCFCRVGPRLGLPPLVEDAPA